MAEAFISRRGGGVDISKANATAANVLKGKTFFSGASKKIQTGTLVASDLVKTATGSADYTDSSSTSWKTITISSLNFKPKLVCYSYLYNNSSPIVSGDETTGGGNSGWAAEINGTVYYCCAYCDNSYTTTIRKGSGTAKLLNNGFTVPVCKTGSKTKWTLTWTAIGY